jgi:hypothetical protein
MMQLPKNYLHDRAILLLLSVNIFLVLAAVLSIVLRLDGGGGDSFITAYRSNLGLNSFQAGPARYFFSFVVLSLFVAGFHTFLSMKTYYVKRQLSVVILALSALLLTLIIIVANALFVLR